MRRLISQLGMKAQVKSRNLGTTIILCVRERDRFNQLQIRTPLKNTAVKIMNLEDALANDTQ